MENDSIYTAFGTSLSKSMCLILNITKEAQLQGIPWNKCIY